MMSETLHSEGTSTMTATSESLMHDQTTDTIAAKPSGKRISAKPPHADCTFRQRAHRYSALPVKTLLKVRMRDLELTNSDLQKVMGYDKPNVVAMMRSGSMRLPVNKVAEVAKVLVVDPVFLLGKVLAENDSALWDVIVSIMGDRLITANEMALIDRVRKVLDGHDVNLAELDEFMQVVNPVLIRLVECEDAMTKAAVTAVDRTAQN